MILRPQLEHTDHQSVLDYYLAHYDEVHITSCNACGEDLAVEVRGQVSGYKQNDYGYTVLPVGANLLSSRVRTDGTMGYQCICGNDTRANAVEEELSPRGEFLPHELAAIHARYTDSYKPKVKRAGRKEVHETFTRERIK